VNAWREDLNKLLSSEESDLFYWVLLLNYFETYKEDLTLEELRRIESRSELCRLQFNERNSDKIERTAVRPNIYEFLEAKEEQQKPTTDSGRDADFIGGCVAVATG